MSGGIGYKSGGKDCVINKLFHVVMPNIDPNVELGEVAGDTTGAPGYHGEGGSS